MEHTGKIVAGPWSMLIVELDSKISLYQVDLKHTILVGQKGSNQLLKRLPRDPELFPFTTPTIFLHTHHRCLKAHMRPGHGRCARLPVMYGASTQGEGVEGWRFAPFFHEYVRR